MAKVNFNTVTKVNREKSRVLNDLKNGLITENKARALGYVASILIMGIEKADLEKRIAELEKVVEKKYD